MLFRWVDLHDLVNVEFHPELLSFVSPLIDLVYEDIALGCCLYVFPSYHEPERYTSGCDDSINELTEILFEYTKQLAQLNFHQNVRRKALTITYEDLEIG
ncbi:unnamed protein product [Nippostrongylus brasiliensis]|uniref:Glycogen [starch] synthase n=1 Tax=Nippostrongylus brasiliensis TaxID=27835 RepID=A0A158R025_NIPBR|nr:unnamed protein product [Nippostrongylus brasiliensis]